MRQVVRRVFDGPQRGEVLGQVGMEELEYLLRLREVLEPVLPERPQRHTLRQHALHLITGRVGEQHLPSVGRSSQSGTPIDGRAEIVALPKLGISGVHGDPHFQIPLVVACVQERLLNCGGRFEC